MRKIFFAFLLSLVPGFFMPALAQQNDTLWVKVINNKWDIAHRMKDGETVFQLARLYNVPPAEVARENGISYNTRLNPGNELYIPLGIYNRISRSGVVGTRPLYYKSAANDDWSRVAFLAGTSAAALREWNGLPMGALSSGQALLVGWVKYDAAQEMNALLQLSSRQVIDTVFIPNDTVAAPVRKSKFQEQFEEITGGGLNVVSEKGAAVYFDSKTTGDTYYAFFNLAPRGAIIKIVNPGNGRFVFAKVIATLPEQDRYQNALIGLSINAQRELGGKGSKTWCEVQY